MIIVLTGATGTGKSKLAIALAKKLDGEVINGDAYQVYQELSIATAKPTKEMMEEVPHHLFDFVPLSKEYDVAEYQSDLRAVLKDVISRGKTPIIAGGTGLYIRAGLYDYDLSSLPEVDMSSYEDLSNEELHSKLKELDPAEAEKIHPNNRIRVMRALTICLSTGESKSSRNAKQTHEPIYPCRFYSLVMDREPLYEKVEKRVDEMFIEGIEEEVRTLTEKYGRDMRAFKAIGVKEFFPYFDGEESLENAKTAIKTNTRHYIKRQETFFRHQFDALNVSNIDDILEDLNK